MTLFRHFYDPFQIFKQLWNKRVRKCLVKPNFALKRDLQKVDNFTSSRNKKVPFTFCVPPLQCPLLFILYLNGSNSHFFFLLQMLVHYPVFYFPVSLACIFLWFLGLFSFFDVTFISKPQFLFFLEQLLSLSHHFTL